MLLKICNRNETRSETEKKIRTGTDLTIKFILPDNDYGALKENRRQ